MGGYESRVGQVRVRIPFGDGMGPQLVRGSGDDEKKGLEGSKNNKRVVDDGLDEIHS